MNCDLESEDNLELEVLQAILSVLQNKGDFKSAENLHMEYLLN
jgi:hypothetical protein